MVVKYIERAASNQTSLGEAVRAHTFSEHDLSAQQIREY